MSLPPAIAVTTEPGRPEVVVVGDAMIDVLVEVRAPFDHATDTPSRVTTAPGGSAANLAVWLARAGRRVAIAASVGDDPIGGIVRQALVGEGIDVSLLVTAPGRTGALVALVEPDGERSMLTDRGANLELRAATVAEAVGGVMAGGHVHVSGYCLLDAATQAAGLAAIDAARSVGATWSLDASSAGPLRSLGPERFLAWAKGASFLFCNLEEGSLLTGQEDPESVARALAMVATEAVVTLGPLGALVATPSSLHMLPAVERGAKDTTGAGDAFGGTYLARRLAGDSIEVAGTAATDVASRVVAQRGARGWSAGYSRE